MHQSLATIDSPEFINLQPLELNPLMSKCEIKVLYIGENRNHSFITKEVATEMSKTLRGAPIVGYYNEKKEDFSDHGERVILDDEGIKFECLTKPYGFVSPDAQVWFQKFEDTDDFGNVIEREYLMTTGYLWTGQFEECKDVLTNGKPHSMELDENTLDGHWSTNTKTGMDFFIINDATFSKLCILGDDVEPCFEGSSVTAPTISNSFSMDDTFRQTLYTMMQDLKNFALEGGQDMENVEQIVENTETEVVEPVETEFNAENTEEVTEATEPVEPEFAAEEEVDAAETTEETVIDSETDFAKADDEDKEEKESEDESPQSDDSDKEEKEEDSKDDEKKKYELLEADYAELQTKFSELNALYEELVAYKEAVEDAKKEELINSFYMLSEEEKADVIANKSNYSYDDIKSKLSVIYVEKTVNFDLEENSKNESTTEESPMVTFSLNETESSTPAWISALRDARNNK